MGTAESKGSDGGHGRILMLGLDGAGTLYRATFFFFSFAEGLPRVVRSDDDDGGGGGGGDRSVSMFSCFCFRVSCSSRSDCFGFVILFSFEKIDASLSNIIYLL